MTITATPYQRGYLRGQMDRGSRRPEPPPPYELGSKEAGSWLEGYRAGRNPVTGPSEIKDAANET